jgi:succinoglycan biosynthesis transport protein ExoP
VLNPAIPPTKRSSPRRTMILAIGLFLGTLIGGFTALARELMDRRIRADEEMVQLLGVPLLTKIAHVRSLDRDDHAAMPALASPEPQAI